MIKTINTAQLIVLTTCLLSCSSNKIITKKLYNPETGKELVFFLMKHVAKPSFYKDAAKKIDSLHKQGYIAFYEGIYIDSTKYTNQEIDTFLRKQRRILGLHLTNYKDSTNLSIPKKLQKEKTISQDYQQLGITKNDIHVDLSIDSLIKSWEHDNNKVPLTNYDFETPLYDPYTKPDKITRYDYLFYFRNKNLLNKIINSKNQKIMVIYGASHYKYIRVDLIYKYDYEKVK